MDHFEKGGIDCTNRDCSAAMLDPKCHLCSTGKQLKSTPPQDVVVLDESVAYTLTQITAVIETPSLLALLPQSLLEGFLNFSAFLVHAIRLRIEAVSRAAAPPETADDAKQILTALFHPVERSVDIFVQMKGLLRLVTSVDLEVYEHAKLRETLTSIHGFSHWNCLMESFLTIISKAPEAPRDVTTMAGMAVGMLLPLSIQKLPPSQKHCYGLTLRNNSIRLLSQVGSLELPWLEPHMPTGGAFDVIPTPKIESSIGFMAVARGLMVPLLIKHPQDDSASGLFFKLFEFYLLGRLEDDQVRYYALNSLTVWLTCCGSLFRKTLLQMKSEPSNHGLFQPDAMVTGSAGHSAAERIVRAAISNLDHPCKTVTHQAEDLWNKIIETLGEQYTRKAAAIDLQKGVHADSTNSEETDAIWCIDGVAALIINLEGTISKWRYRALSSLVKLAGASWILKKQPLIVANLLCSLGDPRGRAAAALLLEIILIDLKSSKPMGAKTDPTAETNWIFEPCYAQIVLNPLLAAFRGDELVSLRTTSNPEDKPADRKTLGPFHLGQTGCQIRNAFLCRSFLPMMARIDSGCMCRILQLLVEGRQLEAIENSDAPTHLAAGVLKWNVVVATLILNAKKRGRTEWIPCSVDSEQSSVEWNLRIKGKGSDTDPAAEVSYDVTLEAIKQGLTCYDADTRITVFEAVIASKLATALPTAPECELLCFVAAHCLKIPTPEVRGRYVESFKKQLVRTREATRKQLDAAEISGVIGRSRRWPLNGEMGEEAIPAKPCLSQEVVVILDSLQQLHRILMTNVFPGNAFDRAWGSWEVLKDLYQIWGWSDYSVSVDRRLKGTCFPICAGFYEPQVRLALLNSLVSVWEKCRTFALDIINLFPYHERDNLTGESYWKAVTVDARHLLQSVTPRHYQAGASLIKMALTASLSNDPANEMLGPIFGDTFLRARCCAINDQPVRSNAFWERYRLWPSSKPLKTPLYLLQFLHDVLLYRFGLLSSAGVGEDEGTLATAAAKITDPHCAMHGVLLVIKECMTAVPKWSQGASGIGTTSEAQEEWQQFVHSLIALILNICVEMFQLISAGGARVLLSDNWTAVRGSHSGSAGVETLGGEEPMVEATRRMFDDRSKLSIIVDKEWVVDCRGHAVGVRPVGVNKCKDDQSGKEKDLEVRREKVGEVEGDVDVDDDVVDVHVLGNGDIAEGDNDFGGDDIVSVAWITVKECAECLHCLFTALPLATSQRQAVSSGNSSAKETSFVNNEPSPARIGLVSEREWEWLGHRVVVLLLAARHPGCIHKLSLALEGLSERLLSSGDRRLTIIPSRWMRSLLDIVVPVGFKPFGTSCDPQGEAPTTTASGRPVPLPPPLRKSVSLGLAFVSILCGESNTAFSKTILLPATLQALCQVASASSLSSSVQRAHRVHGLNVMRAIFRNARLFANCSAESVCSCLECSVENLKHSEWTVRNSATMLFTALVSRLEKNGMVSQGGKLINGGHVGLKPSRYQFCDAADLRDALVSSSGSCLSTLCRHYPGLEKIPAQTLEFSVTYPTVPNVNSIDSNHLETAQLSGSTVAALVLLLQFPPDGLKLRHFTPHGLCTDEALLKYLHSHQSPAFENVMGGHQDELNERLARHLVVCLESPVAQVRVLALRVIANTVTSQITSIRFTQTRDKTHHPFTLPSLIVLDLLRSAASTLQPRGPTQLHAQPSGMNYAHGVLSLMLELSARPGFVPYTSTPPTGVEWVSSVIDAAAFLWERSGATDLHRATLLQSLTHVGFGGVVKTVNGLLTNPLVGSTGACERLKDEKISENNAELGDGMSNCESATVGDESNKEISYPSWVSSPNDTQCGLMLFTVDLMISVLPVHFTQCGDLFRETWGVRCKMRASVSVHMEGLGSVCVEVIAIRCLCASLLSVLMSCINSTRGDRDVKPYGALSEFWRGLSLIERGVLGSCPSSVVSADEGQRRLLHVHSVEEALRWQRRLIVEGVRKRVLRSNEVRESLVQAEGSAIWFLEAVSSCCSIVLEQDDPVVAVQGLKLVTEIFRLLNDEDDDGSDLTTSDPRWPTSELLCESLFTRLVKEVTRLHRGHPKVLTHSVLAVGAFVAAKEAMRVNDRHAKKSNDGEIGSILSLLASLGEEVCLPSRDERMRLAFGKAMHNAAKPIGRMCAAIAGNSSENKGLLTVLSSLIFLLQDELAEVRNWSASACIALLHEFPSATYQYRNPAGVEKPSIRFSIPFRMFCMLQQIFPSTVLAPWFNGLLLGTNPHCMTISPIKGLFTPSVAKNVPLDCAKPSAHLLDNISSERRTFESEPDNILSEDLFFCQLSCFIMCHIVGEEGHSSELRKRADFLTEIAESSQQLHEALSSKGGVGVIGQLTYSEKAFPSICAFYCRSYITVRALKWNALSGGRCSPRIDVATKNLASIATKMQEQSHHLVLTKMAAQAALAWQYLKDGDEEGFEGCLGQLNETTLFLLYI
eukprot:GHVN01019088.1.p1 GENE.GHVN01019088.1~~GHVN01019088.1.p1  ORF type:complete len:2525 (+),score=246.69 GHVN01019088.1:192-7577(+)